MTAVAVYELDEQAIEWAVAGALRSMLPRREREEAIRRMVARGMATWLIAEHAHVSPRTVARWKLR